MFGSSIIPKDLYQLMFNWVSWQDLLRLKRASKFFYREPNLQKVLLEKLNQVADEKIHQLVSKNDSVLFINGRGEVWTCGMNLFASPGPLGFEEGGDINTFTPVPGIADVKQVCLKRQVTYFLKNDGTVWGYYAGKGLLKVAIEGVIAILEKSTNGERLIVQNAKGILCVSDFNFVEGEVQIGHHLQLPLEGNIRQLLSYSYEDKNEYGVLWVNMDGQLISHYKNGEKKGNNVIDTEKISHALIYKSHILYADEKGDVHALDEAFGEYNKQEVNTNKNIVKMVNGNGYVLFIRQSGEVWIDGIGNNIRDCRFDKALQIPINYPILQAAQTASHLFVLLEDNSIKKITFGQAEMEKLKANQLQELVEEDIFGGVGVNINRLCEARDLLVKGETTPVQAAMLR